MMVKNIKDKKRSKLIILSISIVAVILIPMLYSSIYLSAFWDTYGKIDNVPVAFVNLDKQVTKGDKTYNIGKDVEDKLRDNDKVKWNFVSLDEAKKGVEGKNYYAMIVIPSDFSQKLADSSDGKFDKPEVIYEGNKGRNYVFYQISEKVAQSIKSDITSSIQEETSKSLVDNLYDIKSSLNEASDGANKLQDGTNQLVDGSDKLKTGMLTAFNGSRLLENGLKQATEGQKTLTNGTDSLIAGLNQLKSGLSQKNDAIGTLESYADGSVNKTKESYKNSRIIQGGISQLYSGQEESLKSLKTTSDDIKTKVSQILQNSAEKGNKLEQEDIDNLKKVLAESTGLSENATTQMNKDSKESALSKIAGLKNIADNQVNSTYENIKDATIMSIGTKKLETGINENLAKAVEGTDKLLTGTQALKDGSQKLYTGLDNATNKTGDLSSGLSKLNDGSKSLNEGLITANDGTTKLKDGLNTGYNKMNDKLKFTSTDMSSFVSEPVTLKEDTLNNVQYYGEGLAPYFISLSLWLGGMFINLVLSIAKGLKVTDNRFAKSFLGKFIIGASVSVIQALLVSFVLVNVLKIDTISTGYFYLTNIFISLAFFSIMYGVSYAIGIVGTPIMFIVFLLQLASSGGTFPIETAPAFFRIIGEYLPFTYSVGMLRMIIGGVNLTIFKGDVSILLTFIGTFLIGGYIVRGLINSIKKTKENDAVSVLETA